MPFRIHGNRSFTATSVIQNAPAASGVYGLSDSHQWLLIGETPNIQAELLRHLQQPDAFLKEHRPSGFTYELVGAEYRVERHNQLVTELSPAGNRLAR